MILPELVLSRMVRLPELCSSVMGADRGRGVALQRQHGSYAVRERHRQAETLVSMTTAVKQAPSSAASAERSRILECREEGVVPPGLCLKAAVTAQAGIVKAVTGVPLEVNGGAVAGLVGDGQGLLSLLRPETALRRRTYQPSAA